MRWIAALVMVAVVVTLIEIVPWTRPFSIGAGVAIAYLIGKDIR